MEWFHTIMVPRGPAAGLRLGSDRDEPGSAAKRRALESKRSEETASQQRAKERAKLEREIAASEIRHRLSESGWKRSLT